MYVACPCHIIDVAKVHVRISFAVCVVFVCASVFRGRSRCGFVFSCSLVFAKRFSDGFGVERVVFLHHLRNYFLEMEQPPPLKHEQKWDATVDLTLRRFVYGSLSGAASALLLFRSPTTRWAAVAFGAGAGIGSALTDASQIFRGTIHASLPSVSSPSPATLAVPESPSAPAPELERFEEPLVQEAQDA